jgi:NADH:ubiquinone reductase (H+-translocating)
VCFRPAYTIIISMKSERTRIVIVGGGFGGVKTALELADNPHFDVTLLSDRDSFYYYPTLYHTATGGAIEQSKIPLSRLFEGKEITLVEESVTGMDRKKKIISTKSGKTYSYDNAVLALGSLPNYFGIQGIEQYSYNIITPDNARRFKNHLHEQLVNDNKPDLNYVIVGGGPTGIELSGALAGYLKEVMQAHGIRHKSIHIDLVEAAPKLIPRMPDRMSKAVARRLRSLGIKLYLNQKVEGETADALMVNGRPIQSHTVVWNAGTTTSPFFKQNNFALSERGKVVVDDYLQAEPDVYVIGDNAATMYSGMAQTALYDALFVSDNIKRQAEGHLMKRYTPKTPIYVIPVGRNWAAVLWGKQQIYGLLGWLLRLAADLVAFKDYEPWWRAGKQWLTEFSEEEECPTCAPPDKRRK